MASLHISSASYIHVILRTSPIILRPYESVDTTQSQHDANECLFTHGSNFQPEIITSTVGIYMETASGYRMMNDGVFRIAPPVTVTEAQLNLAMSIMEEILRTTSSTMSLYQLESQGSIRKHHRDTIVGLEVVSLVCLD